MKESRGKKMKAGYDKKEKQTGTWIWIIAGIILSAAACLAVMSKFRNKYGEAL